LTAIHTHLGAIFVSLELSRSSWLITSLSPGGGEKMSKHSVSAGDFAGLMERFAQLQEKAKRRMGQSFRIIVVQKAGLDGFWAPRRHRKPCRRRGLMQPRAGAGGQRPTRSMVKRWFERCSPQARRTSGLCKSVTWRPGQGAVSQRHEEPLHIQPTAIARCPPLSGGLTSLDSRRRSG
jgi:hypothetical protein